MFVYTNLTHRFHAIVSTKDTRKYKIFIIYLSYNPTDSLHIKLQGQLYTLQAVI